MLVPRAYTHIYEHLFFKAVHRSALFLCFVIPLLFSQLEGCSSEVSWFLSETGILTWSFPWVHLNC